MLDWYNVGHEDQLRDKLQVNDYLKTIFDKRRNEKASTKLNIKNESTTKNELNTKPA